jgi:hypothetical protein
MNTGLVLPHLLSVLKDSQQRIMSIRERDQRKAALPDACLGACSSFGDETGVAFIG